MEYQGYGTYLIWQIEQFLKEKEEAQTVKEIVSGLFPHEHNRVWRQNACQRVKRCIEMHLSERVGVEERRGNGNLMVKYYKINSNG